MSVCAGCDYTDNGYCDCECHVVPAVESAAVHVINGRRVLTVPAYVRGVSVLKQGEQP